MPAPRQGDFIWYELMTPDAAGAKAFYGDVVGWGFQDMPMPGGAPGAYTILKPGSGAGEAQAGGLMALTEEMKGMGVPPHWSGYVTADDVDATAARAKTLGGAVHMEPMEIPEVGRFAVVADPQGAAFGLFAMPNVPPGWPAAPDTPGMFAWRELHTTDWEAGFRFYADLFGWEKGTAHDMGEMGTYQIFRQGGQDIGGMMTNPMAPMPFWLYYVHVPSITAAMERAKTAGGQVLYGPQEVPGGAYILQATDPQGAMFALVGPKG